MGFKSKAFRSSGSRASHRWEELIAAHRKASALYRVVGEGASTAAKSEPSPEESADSALRELVQLEEQALTWPAEDTETFRFKLSLWADGRVEGYEDEWRVFTEDCERLLERVAGSQRRA